MSQETNAVKLEESWKEVLKNEFSQPYFQALKSFLKNEKEEGMTIYPPGKYIFNAFDSTPFDQVKVVILGQDPYHGPGQAHGLSFSVPTGITQPPSLKNIFKELQEDVGFSMPSHGFLQSWADQGVLLLNSLLTVRARKAGSHKGKGWETFTDAAISAINKHREGIIFFLWGNYAKQKGQYINQEKHYVLTASHPSPFSAHNGFFGCKHFSRANELLIQQGKEPINWQI